MLNQTKENNMELQFIASVGYVLVGFGAGFIASGVLEGSRADKLAERVKNMRNDLISILPWHHTFTSMSDSNLVTVAKNRIEELDKLAAGNEKGRQSCLETQKVWIEALCRAMKIKHPIGQNDVIGQAVLQLELYEQLRSAASVVLDGKARTASMFGKIWRLLVQPKAKVSIASRRAQRVTSRSKPMADMRPRRRVNITRRIINGKRETVAQARKRLGIAQVTSQNRKASRSVAPYNGR